LEAIVGNRPFTGDADAVFVVGDALQCSLDFGNIANLAIHRDDRKLAIAVPGRLHGLIIDFVFYDHFLAQ
jgi:hypothetical protein